MSTSTLLATDTAQVLLAHGDGRDGWWPVFPLFWLLFVGAVVTAVVLSRRRGWALTGQRAGEARLAERFAAGEIDEQEYRTRRAVLKEQTK